ncbi:unnamed protein product [Cylindrotheca closterium]|uniref:Uncharacterized protein n=1 Tax=Cylindrotheca closterium TaxID=2856 RepID=A0AAD2FM42_9STRA|nr:unnamed protein product [Cylindrotheca closterium]
MKLLLQLCSSLLLAWSLRVSSFCISDVSTSCRAPQYRKSHSSTSLNIIGAETIGIALVSAAAGAAARQPEINSMQVELIEARKKVEDSKEQVAKKIEELEEKLFEVDRAYEVESAKFQKEFEKRKEKEVAIITEKIKTDMKFKLDIEIEKEKSKLLSEKLKKVKKEGEESSEIAQLKMQQQNLKSAKEKLELALQSSEEKMKNMETPKANRLWPF